ncbi:hypothetical protein [Streptomyces sp. MW-W600-10]|uniref:hypothetical protein n=1 Tax=Streptomyces sp. MW-W600-10 TaxID=2829819 RepID=UPI001C48B681|nr:hypothetical protein [Streptomyces sp. MW-W600-10]MBV7243666.1 hypothetical protein [Streptomyces sp. MW-W600-10]
MILEVLVTAEPDLPLEVLAQSVDQVADTRAKLRRLAQALEIAPDLLTSGRPEGPRLVELLVRTLRTHGASHLVLPRCAECGKAKPLSRTDGDRRLCSHCGNLLSGVKRRPCAVCGQTRQVSGWDREGRPRCQRHRPEVTGDVEVICTGLQKLDTGLDGQILVRVVELALPLPFQRRKVAEELSRRPELLSGQGAYGSTRVVALIETLIAHGARSVVLLGLPVLPPHSHAEIPAGRRSLLPPLLRPDTTPALLALSPRDGRRHPHRPRGTTLHNLLPA